MENPKDAHEAVEPIPSRIGNLCTGWWDPESSFPMAGTGPWVGLWHKQNEKVALYSDPVVKGSLPPFVALKVFVRGEKDIEACYDKGLKKVPQLRGQVVIKLSLANNVVDTALIEKSTLKDQEMGPMVERCLEKALKKWVFPEPTGDAPVTVTFNLRLANGK